MKEMPTMSYIGYPNRFLCSVFDDMRSCIKTLNFSYLNALIEEAQMLANKMEAALEDAADLKSLRDDIHKLKDTRKALEEEVKEMISDGH